MLIYMMGDQKVTCVCLILSDEFELATSENLLCPCSVTSQAGSTGWPLWLNEVFFKWLNAENEVFLTLDSLRRLTSDTVESASLSQFVLEGSCRRCWLNSELLLVWFNVNCGYNWICN